MKEFKQLEEKLVPIINELDVIIGRCDMRIKYDFQKEFCLNDDIDKVVLDISESKGIYLFEIENKGLLPFVDWYNSFKDKWNFGKVSKSPKLSVIREKPHTKNNKNENWIPLYIGKSESLPKRLRQHIEGYSSTYSLRLKQHDFLKSYGFRITILYLGELMHYDIISPIVESKLRQIINPIVGKQ